MRYFKLTDTTGSMVEYIQVLDDNSEICPTSETTQIEEISEDAYNLAKNPLKSKWNLVRPTM